MKRILWVSSQMFDTEQPGSLDSIHLLFLPLISTAFSLFLLVIVLCYAVLYAQFSMFCGRFCVVSEQQTFSPKRRTKRSLLLPGEAQRVPLWGVLQGHSWFSFFTHSQTTERIKDSKKFVTSCFFLFFNRTY